MSRGRLRCSSVVAPARPIPGWMQTPIAAANKASPLAPVRSSSSVSTRSSPRGISRSHCCLLASTGSHKLCLLRDRIVAIIAITSSAATICPWGSPPSASTSAVCWRSHPSPAGSRPGNTGWRSPGAAGRLPGTDLEPGRGPHEAIFLDPQAHVLIAVRDSCEMLTEYSDEKAESARDGIAPSRPQTEFMRDACVD